METPATVAMEHSVTVPVTSSEDAKEAKPDVQDTRNPDNIDCQKSDCDDTVSKAAVGADNEASVAPVAPFKTPSFAISSKNRVQKNKQEAENPFRKPLPNKSNSQPDNTNQKSQGKTDGNNADLPGTKAENGDVLDPGSGSSLNPGTEQKDSSSQKKGPKLSPAERMKLTQVAIPYKEPPWSSPTQESSYKLEVLKNGAIIETIPLTTKAYYIFGRLPSCDVTLEHPSLSRHHAVVQHSAGSEQFPQGWYLYDLDSTHGTWINKHKVPPSRYHRLHVDHVVKFGGSTRLYILQGPGTDREEESELSIAEMKEQREKQIREAEVMKQAELAEEERKLEIQKQRQEDRGCSWGIDDAEVAEDEEEEVGGVNPFASLGTENEDLYLNDPKKSLNGYFESEGYDLPEYQFDDVGHGKRRCSIELPIDTVSGEPMVAEVVVSGKKKEAVIACALEACRILDRHGLLRKATHESRKRKSRNWEEDDFYDSDEDTFLDRTGTIEKKRQIRMGKGSHSRQKADTYDTLLKKHEGILTQLRDVEAKLEKGKAETAAMESEGLDALDAYMNAIKSGAMDTKTKMKLKIQLMELKQEEQKVRKLVNIAKPVSLPPLAVGKATGKTVPLLSSVGRMKGFEHSKQPRKPVTPVGTGTQVPVTSDSVEEEVEEEEEEEEEQEKTSEVKTLTHSGGRKEADSKSDIGNKDRGSDTQTPVTRAANLTSSSTAQLTGTAKSASSVSTETKPKLRGPTMPLAAVLEKLQEEISDTVDTGEGEVVPVMSGGGGQNVTRKRKKPEDTLSGKKTRSEQSDSYKDSDPDYAVWLPPDNQAGDGRTHLNAKYGY